MPRCLNPNCKDKFEPKYFLQKHCMEKEECIKAEIELKKETIWKAKRTEWKKDLKTLGDYEAEARKEFQKWIRFRDKDEGCISCGSKISIRYDGGHYLDANKYSGLIFNEDNVHKQCSRPCNKDLHGDIINYRIGLIARIGEEKVKWLEENKDRLRIYKYTKQQLIEIKNYYKLKNKESQ